MEKLQLSLDEGFDYAGAFALAAACGYDAASLADLLPDAVAGAMTGKMRQREQESKNNDG